MNRIIGYLLALAAVVALALAVAKGLPELDMEWSEARRDSVRVDSIFITRTDTVTKYQRRVDTVHAVSDSLDASVRIVDDSTVLVRDSAQTGLTPVVIPTSVVANLAALRLTVATQDTLIRALYGKDSTQEWRIATRDKLYRLSLAKANGPRWGYGATLGYGCGVKGCGPSLAVGLTYSAKLPSPRQLLRAVLR